MLSAQGPGERLAKLLARRDLTVAEARERLAAAGVEDAAVEAAVAWGLAGGYLDDARLAARVIARELEREPPPATTHLIARLEGRGIPAQIAAAAVRAGASSETLGERVLTWIESVRGRVPARRIAGKLSRAGHDFDTVAGWLTKAGLDSDPEDRVQDTGDRNAFYEN